jgi:hypothetical protein
MVADVVRNWVAKGHVAPSDKGTGRITTWPGLTLLPEKTSIGNMKVLQTDYDSFAIIYRCAPGYTFDLQGGE